MTETTKTLPEIYREAADLILAKGKTEGQYRIGESYCTMGAVFETIGLLSDNGVSLKGESTGDFHPDFLEYAGPVADQIVKSGRNSKYNGDDNEGIDPEASAFVTIYRWNDRGENSPTAEDVAALLRETADSMEVTA